MAFSIGDVQPTTKGYGFSILGDHREPILTIAFENGDAAKAARAEIEAALAEAVAVTSQGKPGRTWER